MESLHLRDLSKKFGSATAVDHIDLDIANGELVSLLGPSGCGKTTTLRMVAGFLSPDTGEILRGDRVLSSTRSSVPPHKRNMSMIFQSFALWPHMTVYDNVAYGIKLRKVSRDEAKRRVSAMLDVVHMGDLAGRYPGELSGGQQQRVALARALAVEPEVLLLDEPLSNLDANLREEMRLEIRRLHNEFGITTIYVTHDLTEAMVVSDRIVVMNAGKIDQIGSAEEIYERPRTRFVAGFIGQVNLLSGTAMDSGSVAVGEPPTLFRTECLQSLTKGQDVTIAVRPHDFAIHREAPAADNGTNSLPGRIVEHVYLGESRSYVVALGNEKTQVRVAGLPGEHFLPGERVFLRLPAEKCRILPQ